MPYKIEVDFNRNILIVRHYGSSNIDEYCTSPAKVAPVLAKYNLTKALIDISKSDFNMNTVDLFDYVLEIREFYPPGTKIATVYSSDGLTPENIRFLENLAYNRAIHLKTFCDKESALHWLNGNGL